MIETVKIKDGDNGVRIINKADFVEGKHQLCTEPPPKANAKERKK